MTAYFIERIEFNNGGNGAKVLPEYLYDSHHIVNIAIGGLFAYGGAEQVGDTVLLHTCIYNSSYDDLSPDEVQNMAGECIQYYYRDLGSEAFAPTPLREG